LAKEAFFQAIAKAKPGSEAGNAPDELDQGMRD